MVNATGTKKTSKQLHLVQKDTKYSCLLEKCHLDRPKKKLYKARCQVYQLLQLENRLHFGIRCLFTFVAYSSQLSQHDQLACHPFLARTRMLPLPTWARMHATQHDTSTEVVKACSEPPTPLGIWLLADSDLSQWPFNEIFMKWWTESVGCKSFDLISNKSSLATQPSSAALFCCCHSQAFFQGGFGCCWSHRKCGSPPEWVAQFQGWTW